MAYNMLNVSQSISIPRETHPNTLPVTIMEYRRVLSKMEVNDM